MDLCVAMGLLAFEEEVFGWSLVSLELRKDGDMGVTPPHVERDGAESKPACLDPGEALRGKEDSASVEATDPEMLAKVTGT